MAHIYFIGGTPRTGKTTLANLFTKSQPIASLCADHIRYLLRNLVSSEDYPELFAFIKYVSNDSGRRQELQDDHQKALLMQIAESRMVWASAQAYIQSSLNDDQDLLVEGLAIMPEFLKDNNYEFSAIFLGNQSYKHRTIVERHARDNSFDWMHDLDTETISMFADLNLSYSKLMEQESKKLGYQYYEIHDQTFEQDLNEARDFLLSQQLDR